MSVVGRKIVDLVKASDGTIGLQLDNGQVVYIEKDENESVM